MKAGMTLSDLAKEVERRAAMKRDYVVPTPAMEMLPSGRVTFGDQNVAVNDFAAGQIAEHCGIPAKYAKRMQAEAPELWAANVNAWFRKEPAARMARTLDGTLRAFVSDRFRPLEDIDLAEAALPALAELDLDVMSTQITDRRFYIKAVGKQLSRELAKHGAALGDGGHTIVDVLYPAVTLSNSEVGDGALSILVGTYTKGCSNLATFSERSMRKYHIGGKHEMGEAVYALLSDQTRRVTDAAIWAQVRDVVKAAFNAEAFNSLVDTIAGTQADKIADPIRVIELSTRKFGLTEGERTGVLKHLIEGADLSRFGLHNAITRAAQDLDDYDRASAFERMGGQIIELPRGEWAELAKAA